MNEYDNLADAKASSNKFITHDDVTRRFLVFKSLTHFLKIRKDYIHLHEVILHHKKRKFFVDLDARDIDVEICNKHKNRIIAIIKALFAKIYNYLVDDSYIVVIDSSGMSNNKYKYSINLVINKYAFHDYAEFKWFGSQVSEKYYSFVDAIPGFLDNNFFTRKDVNSHISSRFPGCTKKNEGRYKVITSNHTYEEGIISNTSGCEDLPLKSDVDRNACYEKYKKEKYIEPHIIIITF